MGNVERPSQSSRPRASGRGDSRPAGAPQQPPVVRPGKAPHEPSLDDRRGLLAESDRAFRVADAGLRRWVPPLASFLVLVAGIVDVVSVLTPEFKQRLHDVSSVVTGPVARSASAATLALGLLLILLAHGLRRRKRRAWRAAVVLLLFSAVFNVVKGLDVEEATLALLVAIALVVYRSEFRGSSDFTSRWRAVVVFVQLGVASIVLGEIAIQIRVDRLTGSHSFGQQLQQVLYGLVGIHGPLHFRNDNAEDLITRLLIALGLLTVLATAYIALRPAEPRPLSSEEDQRRLRGLLDEHGSQDSLGYFALRGDKSVLWSPSGKSAIAYRVVSGVMLASGDPLGDPEAWPGAIDRFLSMAIDHAWTPAVMGCSEAGGTAWARAGLDVLELGDEAVVSVADFTLEGRPMRGVRQAVARVERGEYVFDARRVRDVPPAELAAMRDQATLWRGAETERGFSMALGRFGSPGDGDCVVATARRDDVLAALLHFVPWGPDGLSLDLMVRDRAADNGMNEFLIAKLLQQAPQLGVTQVSLNFAVFRSALARGEQLGAGFVLRWWRGALLLASRWFQIESLYRFNAKFRPIWEPRYVCYPAARDLPRVALAALEAEAFLVWPTSRVRDVMIRRRHPVPSA
jgi:lysyl-tRNA synthetase class 2